MELPDDLSNSEITLTANQENGGYKNIALSDIYSGKFIAESENNNEITFTVNGVEYRAKDGQTWEEWVNSSYNAGVFRLKHSSNDGCTYAVYGDYDTAVEIFEAWGWPDTASITTSLIIENR